MRGIDKYFREAVKKYGHEYQNGVIWLTFFPRIIDGISMNGIFLDEEGNLMLSREEWNEVFAIKEIEDLLSVLCAVREACRVLSED